MVNSLYLFIKNNFNILLQIITLIISISAILVAWYTALLTKKNQKRNERYLMYQFKLESLNSKISKKSGKLWEVINNHDYEKCSDKSLNNAINIKEFSNEYKRIYNKMVDEFWLGWV